MAFAPGEVEDGTGLDDAIVYEEVADAEAWLTRRQKTVFSGKTEAEKEAILINATAAVDAEFATLFVGVNRRSTQGLVWPAAGARAVNGRLIHDNEIPKDHLIAIRLVCELQAAGQFLTDAGLNGVKRFKGGPAEVEWHQGSRTNVIRAAHPEVWLHMRRNLPGDP